jgi:hypothetical protein
MALSIHGIRLAAERIGAYHQELVTPQVTPKVVEIKRGATHDG